MVTKTSAEAQKQFRELLEIVRGEPVAITEDGQTAAYLISPDDMETVLEEKERRRKAVEAFKVWSERALREMTPAAAELTDEEVNRMVHELRDQPEER